MLSIARFLTCLGLLAATAEPALGKAGTLDQSFGIGGIAQPALPQIGSTSVARTLVQADGGILVLFHADKTAFVLRLLPTGALDRGYGNQGVASLPKGNEFAHDIALQADGKLLVCGERITMRNRAVVMTGMIWRLKTDGTLDASWGRRGALPVPLPNDESAADADVASLLVQPNGQIDLQLATVSGAGVGRLNADGSLDTTFGNGGAVLAFGGDEIISMALQTDGKILLAAQYFDTKPIMFRLTATGAIDRSTSYGHIVSSTGANTFQPSGGYIIGPTQTTAINLARINPAGARDTRFASPTIDFSSLPIHGDDLSAYYGLAAEGNGDVVIIGAWQENLRFPPVWGGVARVRNNGRIDASFGIHGANKVLVMGPTFFTAIAVQPDGKIVVAGGDGSGERLLVVRFLGR